MMKSLISAILALALLLSLFAGAAAAPANSVPEVGETVHGFTLKETRAFPMIGAHLQYYVHDKTGAEVLYLANHDTNRVFDLTFFTKATDNTGIPHVLEHAVLDGSDKYPSSSLFFNLSYQTYNTYMNAATGANYTTFPVASLSEAQLLRYADFYTDSCLHPRVLEDESIFREEAWRYRLEEAGEPLTLEGTVYSEMLSASNIYQASYYNMLKTAFPGSVSANVSGGDPSAIPEMSWEALKSYHQQFYHPSNCIAFLYGEFQDFNAFLKLLDEAFSPYEKRDCTFHDSGFTPFRGDTKQQFSYPVEAETDTENGADVYYILLCPGLKGNTEDELYLNTMTDLIASDSSPVSRRLQEALPTAFMSAWISLGTPEDAVMFNISGLDPEDAETAAKAIDEGLQEIAENGFERELVENLSDSLNLNLKLSHENTALGIGLLTAEIIPYYAETGRLFEYLDYVEGLQNIIRWNSEGKYQKVTEDWLVNCEDRVLTITYPEAGLREKLDAEEEARLEEIKAAMSEEELQNLMEAAQPAENETEDYVAQLQAVTVSSLPEEVRHYEITDETDASGIRHLSAEADVEDICMPVVLLDASAIPQENLHWFVLYLSMLGQLDTEEHTKEELEKLASRYFYGAELRQSLMDNFGTKEYHPYLRAGWISTGENLKNSYDLLYELLFETVFDDTQDLKDIVERNRTGQKFLINDGAYQLMMYREFGANTPLYAYHSYCSGLEYNEFLKKTEEQLEKEPETVARQLKEIQEAFRNSYQAVSLCAGDAPLLEENHGLADEFFSKLEHRQTEPAVYQFEKPAATEALVIDDTVQYNGIVASYEDMGLSEYTADLDAVASLITDLYLMPMLREIYGVYTPMHYYDNFAGAYLITYRDPNIEETFEVYEAIPTLLKKEELDQETLDGYILSCYSAYAMPEGELGGALNALTSHLCGEPEDLKVQYMEELKSLSPERIKAYSEAYEKLIENGTRFTIGSASAIAECEENYQTVLRP